MLDEGRDGEKMDRGRRLSGGGGGDAGGSAQEGGSDLTQAGLSEGMPPAPVYHALKGGHAGAFEVLDHPAGSLKTCLPLNFYAIG